VLKLLNHGYSYHRHTWEIKCMAVGF
jgi:hypothetical protein